MDGRQWAISLALGLGIVLAGCAGQADAPADAGSAAPAAEQAATEPAATEQAATEQTEAEQPAAEAQAALPAGLADLPQNADGYTDISVEQLATALGSKNFTLVNTHIPYEGELPATDLFLPFDTITAHLDELPAKDAAIVLYCRSGNMSTTAAAALAAQGYTHVYELDGGFNAWKAAGKEFLVEPQ